MASKKVHDERKSDCSQPLEGAANRYSQLSRLAPHACVTFDGDGRILKLNQRWTELTGYSLDDLVGRSVLELPPDRSTSKARACQLLQRFQAGKEFHDEELEMCKVDGRSMWVSVSVHPVFDCDGRVVAGNGMIVDITKYKQVLEVQKKTIELLQALVRTCLVDLRTIFWTFLKKIFPQKVVLS